MQVIFAKTFYCVLRSLFEVQNQNSGTGSGTYARPARDASHTNIHFCRYTVSWSDIMTYCTSKWRQRRSTYYLCFLDFSTGYLKTIFHYSNTCNLKMYYISKTELRIYKAILLESFKYIPTKWYVPCKSKITLCLPM